MAANFIQCINHTAACSFGSAMHATLRYWFTGNTAVTVNIAGPQCHIGIKYPGHFPLTGSVIGCRYINAGAYKVFLYQLGSVSAGNSFQYFRRCLAGRYIDTTFCAAKRHINNGAFVSH